MLQIIIQKCIVNIHYFSLQVFNEHSCHHNSESDITDHWGVVIHEIHARNLAETFATSLAQYTPLCFTLNTHLHPNNLQSCGQSFLFTCLQTPMSNIFLNSRQTASHHFLWLSDQDPTKLLGNFVAHQDLTLCLSQRLSHVTIHLRSFPNSHLQMYSLQDLIQVTVWFLLQLALFDFLFLKQLAHQLPLQLRVLLALLLEVDQLE